MESLRYLAREQFFRIPGQRAALRPLKLTGPDDRSDAWALHDMICTKPPFLQGLHDLAEYQSPYVQYRFETVRRDQKGEFLGFVDMESPGRAKLAGWIMFLSGLHQARAAAAVWDDNRLVAEATPVEITIMKAKGVEHEVVVSALDQAGLLVLLHDLGSGLAHFDESTGTVVSPRVVYGDIHNENLPAQRLVQECGYTGQPMDSLWNVLIPQRERGARQVFGLDWTHLAPLLTALQLSSPSLFTAKS